MVDLRAQFAAIGEDTMAAVILEGSMARVVPPAEQVGRLKAASKAKYGYGPPEAAYAAGLASGPSRAYALTKRALVFGQTSTYADALALESELQVEAGRTRDHRNAVAAFLRKEPPVFEGR